MGRGDSDRATAVDVLLVAVGAGLVIGLGEVLGLAWRTYGRGALTHVSPHVAWMAPFGYAVLFLSLAPLAIGVRALRRQDPRAGLGPIVFMCMFFGMVGWIMMLQWPLHYLAVLALAAGIAFQAARLAERHAGRVVYRARRSVPVLVTIVAGLAGTVFGLRARAEAAANAALGDADPGAPNVVLLILDTVRARSLGLYGGKPLVSPSIDALASSSIVFANALAPGPWTLPSHASMFTGRWPHELSVGWSEPLDDADATLAEALAARGYATAGFVGNLSYGSRPFGLHRGFARYEDFPLSSGQVVLSTSLGRVVSTIDWLRARLDRHELLNRKTAARVNDDFLDWLAGRPDRPFFAFLNYFDAHEPYEPPREIREAFAPDYRRSNIGHRHNLLRGVNSRRLLKAEMPAEDVPRELALYEGAIKAVDIEIGRLLARLETDGLLDNTIVILTSDHGESFGEHGVFEHGQSLYEAAIRVPLVVRPAGGVEGGRRVLRPVSLRDIPATVLDLTASETDVFPGASLAATWSDDEAVRRSALVSPAVAQLHRGLVEQPWYPIAAGQDMQAMMSGSLYYLCNPDATEELYDLAVDPGETDNLAGTPHGDQAILAFRSAIAPVGAPPRVCPPPPEQAPQRPQRGR